MKEMKGTRRGERLEALRGTNYQPPTSNRRSLNANHTQFPIHTRSPIPQRSNSVRDTQGQGSTQVHRRRINPYPYPYPVYWHTDSTPRHSHAHCTHTLHPDTHAHTRYAKRPPNVNAERRVRPPRFDATTSKPANQPASRPAGYLGNSETRVVGDLGVRATSRGMLTLTLSLTLGFYGAGEGRRT